ncbi:MAG: ATP-binding protein [Methanobacteriota archaeon]|nr:MAG: ATP-binding protein [Euryarchaeota archaeon]
MPLNPSTDQIDLSTSEADDGFSEADEGAANDAPARHRSKTARTSHHGGLEAVGVIYGNVGTLRFNMVITAPLEKMEFVQVRHKIHGFVLGQVSEIERKTNLTTDGVKSMRHGAPVEIEEKEIATVSIVGYRDDRNLLQAPRTPLLAGEEVYRAQEELIKDVVGIKEHTDTGAYVGLLSGHDVRVELDINLLVQKHVCILSKTGGGKSYCSGALIEEFMKQKVTVCVIDPHGEYSSMRKKGSIKKTHRDFHIKPRGYADKILEFATDTNLNKHAHPLKFTLHNLDARDILGLTNTKNVRSYLTMLRRAIDTLRDTKENFSIADIIAVLEANNEQSSGALITELEYLNEIEVFAEQGTKIDELIQKGKTTIINLRGTPPDMQELIVNRIGNALFELRKVGKIPPMMLVVEEAHNFCPQQGQVACSKVFRTVASEGRKFGLGLLVISQRPAKVDKNVLSQCNTQIILKVNNPNDIKAIASSIEGLTEGMEEEIQRLPIGTAIVTGGGVSMPLFVDIRPRESQHGGESVEIVPHKRM